MKEETSKKVKKIACDTIKKEMSTNEFLIHQIMGSIDLNFEEEKNIIAKVRIGNDAYDIWKPGKDGKYIIVNTMSHKKDSTLYLTKEEMFRDIILKAFFDGDEYKKVAKKLIED